MKRVNRARDKRALVLMTLVGGTALPGLAMAQIEAAPEVAQVAPAEAPATEAPVAELASSDAPADTTEEVIVNARVNKEVNILPREPVDSVFGFEKSIAETPRSLTSISNETMNKLNINEIDDLVALSPGAYTQSFFGVAGSLDVRGTPGENYFRGVRRIDNPGNYPTPIGASDRIDIVRGPASPIYGPSKIGGYLNFVPKSARAADGQYSTEASGELGITRGSWDKNVLHAEVGGPGNIDGQKFGYYLYAESENSGSYYDNTSTNQSLYQASIDAQLTDSSRIEFGGLYQDFDGNQVAGWNRLTQDLVDHGTYITGSPPSLDTNGDGKTSAAEAAAGDLGIFYFGGVGAQDPATVDSDLSAHPNMALVNPGTTHIKGNQVLVAPDDVLATKVGTLYFDFIHDFGGDFKLTNKSFYEKMTNINENAYGFSQFADTYAFEDQVNFSYKYDFSDDFKSSYQFGPSIRYQNFKHGDNFDFEYFDRRDITKPNSPIDIRTLSTRDGTTLEPYSSHDVGHYTDAGFALLGDFTALERIHLLVGGRYDSVDVTGTCEADADGCTPFGFPTDITGIKQHDSDDGISWTGSLSYDIPVIGVIPYFTRAKQTTLIVGQGGEVPASNIASGTTLANSNLTEIGAKGNFWNNRIYAALDWYKQERVDFSSQNTVTNNTTEAKGYEFEFRGVLTNNLALSGAFTTIKVTNLTAVQDGYQFGFAGGSDLPAGIDPSRIYGGVVNGYTFDTDGRKAGVPQKIYSLYLIYNFDQGTMLQGLTATVGATHVDATYSGFSKAVLLPSYTLVNAGLNYETKHWKLGLQGKNLTNERYFRSNFPDLFGSSVVLPELPRNYLATMTYKF
ncbi:MAG: TonB-dependent receptor [Hydrocarboniphaga sp.]|uniref:TonB-dependent siderophore receptor n=1 Tax=Hydrocarboniphaga sp. TaxID=2033016 RepID=UPI002637782A|nr:TonB-dependent receptor [Hydrocarboniphaga sp.]MDB5971562.1 TonB-dependent receptor [Hydrocarboniphaga sp.]